MALIKSDSNKPKVGIPPAMKDRYVVRIQDKKFGPNSKGNPMITVNCELIGRPNTTGSLDTSVKKGNATYVIAGLRTQPVWFTLTEKALPFFEEFWAKANPGLDFPGVDPENPDLTFLDGLCMEVIADGREQVETKQLTDEEKEALKAAGKPVVGEPILDGDGNEIKRTIITISQWLKKYTGDIPSEVGPY